MRYFNRDALVCLLEIHASGDIHCVIVYADELYRKRFSNEIDIKM